MEERSETAEEIGLLASDQQLPALRSALEQAGFAVRELRDADEVFVFRGSVFVEASIYPSARERAAMLARLSSVNRDKVVIGIVKDAEQQRQILEQMVEIDVGVAVDLCLEDAVALEATGRLALAHSRVRRTYATDPLTQLGVRVAMRDHLDFLLKDLPSTRVAAAFLLDLDHFKTVNDTFGHGAGDEVLRQCGFIVRNFGAVGMRAFRVGGDEIGGVLIEPTRAAVVETLESLSKAIRNARFQFKGQDIGISATIGFTFLSGDLDVEQAFTLADTALYAAKNAERGTVQPFDILWDQADEDADKAAFAHLENVTKLWTERLSHTILSVARKAFEVSRETADRDGLTGLYNRRHFDRRLAREIQNSTESDSTLRRELSLVMLDVDNFHDVNMTYGYPTGDDTLQHVAQAAVNHSRTTDWVARYGGEEFVVVMPESDLDDALMVAERVRAAIEAMTVSGFEGRTLQVTVSIGIATLREVDGDRRRPEALVQIASDRLVAAKKAGKNRVVGAG